jgi:hypothetical protein
MATLPVEQTIGDSYRFVFRNLLSVFGIAWLPLMLIIAVFAAGLWVLRPELTGLAWPADPDPAHNREIAERLVTKIAALALPLEIVVSVLFVMLAVGIQRKALGLIKGAVFVFFSLGGAVWRLFFGLLLAGVLVWLSTALSIGAAVLVFSFGRSKPVGYALVEFAAVIACICWFFYFVVRLGFFIPPAVVAEGGLGIRRSWALGRGNFWRIAIVVLACVVGPSIVVSMATNIVVWPFLAAPLLRFQQAMQTHQVLPQDEVLGMASAAIRQILPLWAGIHLVTFPIMMGLSNAMSAFAYRHLTAPEPVV